MGTRTLGVHLIVPWKVFERSSFYASAALWESTGKP